MAESLTSPTPNGIMFEKGDLVWFDPGVGHMLPGEVIEYHRGGQVLTVQAVIAGKAQTFTLTTLDGVERRQDLGQSGVEDMTQLSDLNEASILWNLKIRYDKGLIYTYTGSILIAVNPYRMFDMYGLDHVKRYEGKVLGTLPPHLFAIGAAAFASLTSESPRNQVVIISGESGSGKTESTKLVMQYLAAVNRATSNLITEQILEASPLLEAFGNAKTARNDNSSRFGKYLEVHFNNGLITGAQVTEYLLEKSRIVTHAPGERNYHVFYEMLKGLNPQQRDKYGLLTADKYFYLNQGGEVEIDGKDDADDWSSLCSAMQVLGLTSDEQDSILRVLASVLHLGNVYFHRKALRHGQEGVEIGSDAEVRWVGHLLHLDSTAIKKLLTTKTTEARGERVHIPLTIDQALDARDAIAKTLYSTLFGWLVTRINNIVQCPSSTPSINLLDIFGFEDFRENSFEQLCINYANEHLHHYFNKCVFKIEQAEYAKERLQWTPVSYADNSTAIALLAKKPVGILHLLDDESNFPKSTDLSFLEKCHYNHALDELYSRPRMPTLQFGVRHFAGNVWYNVEGFLDKNRDPVRPELIGLIGTSNISILTSRWGRNAHDRNHHRNINSDGRFVTMKPRTPTVAARFHDSLVHLLEHMSGCQAWFVKCLKPNIDKAPMRFELPVVLQQLRYSGMLDTVRIRQAGYPVRLTYGQLAQRFRCLVLASAGLPSRQLCRSILETADPSGQEFQLGATKAFLRESLSRRLEARRAALLGKAAITLQRFVRGTLARTRLRRKRQAALMLQAWWRGGMARRKYLALRKGTVLAQALYRGKRQRRTYRIQIDEARRRHQLEKASRERAKAKQQAAAAAGNSGNANQGGLTTRPVAGVNHLEIPAELAFIFSKLDDWQPIHQERHIGKATAGTISSLNPDDSELRLPPDIDAYAFAKYAGAYAKARVWGARREPIAAPFLAKPTDHDASEAIALFKLVLRFMNDTSLNGRRERALADYIAYKGLSNERLRDELLCQLVNQTWRQESADRGWLLLTHCLSTFLPSPTLYKYLLKYISDQAPSGAVRTILQQKLLRAALSPAASLSASRSYPPTILEWKITRQKARAALPIHLPDELWSPNLGGRLVSVHSWSSCGELASAALRSVGATSLDGWTLALHHEDGTIKEAAGSELALDFLGEIELPPSFPSSTSPFICTSEPISVLAVAAADVAVATSPPRRPAVPPPEPPKRATSPSIITPAPAPRNVMRSTSREHLAPLSRKSALNDRYFEERGRSRSLDDLLEPAGITGGLEALGLSHSRLNERYRSADKVDALSSSAATNQEYMAVDDALESVSQRGGRPPPRFIKSQYAGKRAPPGSHSSRAQIEGRLSEGAKSSAMSDTSEAPSLASHVRRVRVPSHASDVDQYLDELFMPVLDANLDELSDARSLAASIKGGGGMEAAANRGPSTNGPGVSGTNGPGTGPTSMMLPPLPLFPTSNQPFYPGSSDAAAAAAAAAAAFMPVPLYNMQGISLPPFSSPPPNSPPPTPGSPQAQAAAAAAAAYQANLQRAFLQSAMAQNLQIQQQLMAQNQALQQMLTTQPLSPLSASGKVSFREPEDSDLWSTEKQRIPNMVGHPAPPPMPLLTTTTSLLNSNSTSTPARRSSGSNNSAFSNVLSELKSRRGSQIENGITSNGGAPPPPPPPMPPPPDPASDPSGERPFLDPYGRAKTVRIGKWRWPPPKGDNDSPPGDTFLQFKLRQHQRKTTPQQGGGINEGIEWDEFEMGPITSTPTPPPPKDPSISIATNVSLAGSSKGTGDSGGRASFEPALITQRPSPGSIGKLRISSEMRSKLEQVTANHSIRSSKPDSKQRTPVVNKLEDGRKAKLEQQLTGRWDAKEERSDHQNTNIVRSKVERMEKDRPDGIIRNQSPIQWSRPPPPPVTPSIPFPMPPLNMNGLHLGSSTGIGASATTIGTGGAGGPSAGMGVPSRSSSFYSRSSPPPPIQPVTSASAVAHALSRNSNSGAVAYGERRSSVSTHATDKLERIEIEESAEFLPSLDPRPPPSAIRRGGEIDDDLPRKSELQPPLPSHTHTYTYARVGWWFVARKEIFAPGESLGSIALHLVFCQIIHDCLVGNARISRDQRNSMRQLLDSLGVGTHPPNQGEPPYAHISPQVKKNVVDTAREWPAYFARLYPVNSGNNSSHSGGVQLLAVSHSGVRLLRRESNNLTLSIIEMYGWEQLSEAAAAKSSVLRLGLSSGAAIVLYTHRAHQAAGLVARFLRIHRQVG